MKTYDDIVKKCEHCECGLPAGCGCLLTSTMSRDALETETHDCDFYQPIPAGRHTNKEWARICASLPANKIETEEQPERFVLGY